MMEQIMIHTSRSHVIVLAHTVNKVRILKSYPRFFTCKEMYQFNSTITPQSRAYCPYISVSFSNTATGILRQVYCLRNCRMGISWTQPVIKRYVRLKLLFAVKQRLKKSLYDMKIVIKLWSAVYLYYTVRS